MMLDSQRRCIYAWTPHHKLFEVKVPFTTMGPAEVVCMIDIILPLVKGALMEPTDKRRQIFDKNAHVTMDIFFSGDEILRYRGEDGWKTTTTCRRDWLPKEVPKIYVNFIKAEPVNTRSKVSRFEQPIIVVKNVIQPKKKASNDNDNVKGTRATKKTMS